MAQIINKTSFGLVFRCSQCKKIHIEFNNINLNFSETDYKRFSDYIYHLDGQYWAELNTNSPYRRKIRIPISATPICLMLTVEELSALRKLLENTSASAEEELIRTFHTTIRLN
ncbi:DUF6686 family protein [Proteiniphilum acetatigenes]|uniref:DUF6686 family protein n=1 Tax=Proteiniphilum acetatigenes TaxID=294710 RepID=UPI00036309E6|nr:DUF6686 family protein [Proteiniphilum acetatigenes]SFK48239.1 hypothetical protein SAMN05216357_102338 [Porphyromonadaceae bacterium KH3CP3RA]